MSQIQNSLTTEEALKVEMDIHQPSQLGSTWLSAREFKDAVLSGSQSPLVRSILEKDGDYLLRAYENVEQLWSAQFHSFERVHLVLLSEAPLFGEQKQSYIYNPEAGATAFLNYNDYTKAFGGYGPSLPVTGPVIVRKTALLNALREIGVLVLDLFPFALNDKTSKRYDALSASDRTELFEATCPAFFRLKLSWILRKATPHTLFAFRYERVRNACEGLVRTELAHLKINSTRLVPECISAPRGILRHDQLRTVYQRSRPPLDP
jgi:hypothetical protein